MLRTKTPHIILGLLCSTALACDPEQSFDPDLDCGDEDLETCEERYFPSPFPSPLPTEPLIDPDLLVIGPDVLFFVTGAQMNTQHDEESPRCRGDLSVLDSPYANARLEARGGRDITDVRICEIDGPCIYQYPGAPTDLVETPEIGIDVPPRYSTIPSSLHRLSYEVRSKVSGSTNNYRYPVHMIVAPQSEGEILDTVRVTGPAEGEGTRRVQLTVEASRTETIRISVGFDHFVDVPIEWSSTPQVYELDESFYLTADEYEDWSVWDNSNVGVRFLMREIEGCRVWAYDAADEDKIGGLEYIPNDPPDDPPPEAEGSNYWVECDCDARLTLDGSSPPIEVERNVRTCVEPEGDPKVAAHFACQRLLGDTVEPDRRISSCSVYSFSLHDANSCGFECVAEYDESCV